MPARSKVTRWLDKRALELGRALTRAGRAATTHIEKHPHATVACAAAITAPIIGATLGPVAGKVATVAAEAVIFCAAVHAVCDVARKHNVPTLEVVAALPAPPDLLALRRTVATSAVDLALSFVPSAAVAYRAVEAVHAADRAFRIVTVARAEAVRLARAS